MSGRTESNNMDDKKVSAIALVATMITETLSAIQAEVDHIVNNPSITRPSLPSGVTRLDTLRRRREVLLAMRSILDGDNGDGEFSLSHFLNASEGAEVLDALAHGEECSDFVSGDDADNEVWVLRQAANRAVKKLNK